MMKTRKSNRSTWGSRCHTLAAIALWLLPAGMAQTKAQTAYAVFDESDQSLTFRYDDNKPDGAYEMAYEEYSSIGRVPSWFEKCAMVSSVVFDSSFAQYRPTDCSYWFYHCERLKSIEGIEHLNTERVTNMRGMFFYCKELTSLDASHFNTQYVTDMNGMFRYCKELASLDVSHFQTEHVTDMGSMFSACKLLSTLDLSNFNTANVTDMSYMFSDSQGLTNIDISNFQTDSVKNMGYMFNNCKSLTTLDLSSFNTGVVTDMTWMFRSCAKLQTIYTDETFTTDSIHVEEGWGKDLFKGCTALEGAIKYDAEKTDYRYANFIDGYFTYKEASGIATPNRQEQTEDITVSYDLSGRRINAPKRGINILRKGRKTIKLMVR